MQHAPMCSNLSAMRMNLVLVLLAALALAGCSSEEDAANSSAAEAPVVREGAEGYLLTWFDGEGPHIVESVADVPEEHRGRVRVQALSVGPEERDPDTVWLANLTAARGDGTYAVQAMTRDEFDALLDEAGGVEFAEASEGEALAQNDIIIYGASWCHACRGAAEYLRSRNVPFVERDIEAEPGARAEMQAKARAAGIQPSGIPVIDFRGTMLTGFDQRRMDALLRES